MQFHLSNENENMLKCFIISTFIKIPGDRFGASLICIFDANRTQFILSNIGIDIVHIIQCGNVTRI